MLRTSAPAPGVDALVVVAHRARRCAGARPARARAGTGRGWCPGTRRPARAAKRVCQRSRTASSPSMQLGGDHQQVVEVHRAVGAQARRRSAGRRGRRSRRGTTRRAAASSSGPCSRLLASEMRAWTARGGDALGVDLLVDQAAADEAQLVVGVVDREVARVAGLLGLAAQDPHARRVEGAGPDRPRPRAHQPADAVAHLPRRLVGEGDGEDRLGRDARPRRSGARRGGSGRGSCRCPRRRARGADPPRGGRPRAGED